MTATQRYTFAPELQPPHTYEVAAGGLGYRPPGGQRRELPWEAIRYLEDVSGHKVEVVAGDAATIPIYYGTHQFAHLLAEVCGRLAALHGDKLAETRRFQGNRGYFAHSGAVLVVFAVLLIGGWFVLEGRIAVWLFLAAALLPMALYVLRQPHTVTLLESGLEVKDYVRTRFIPYAQIASIRFDRYGDKQTAYLCIRVQLSSGRRLTLLRLENLVLLYLMMVFQWERRRAKPTPAPRA
jgi:hypothetical protein